MAPYRKSPQLTPPFAAFASVSVDIGPKRPLDYGILPKELAQASVGQRVLVPIKNKLREGTILAIKKSPPPYQVRPIARILSKEPPLFPELLSLAEWMSAYYCTPLRQVITTLLPSIIRTEGKEKKQLCVYQDVSPKKLTLLLEKKEKENKTAQVKALKFLTKHPKGVLLSLLLKQTALSASPLRSLEKEKIIKIKPLVIERSPIDTFEFFKTKPKKLNEEQARCLSALKKELASKAFHTHLIHGITGSGKTEIYMQAIEAVRAQKRGVILLVPEIALTSQTIERLKARFDEKIGVIHSRLSAGERFDIWHAVRRKEISLTIGARSAIFSPIQNLGLIIVDEEHDTSYKSEEQPCYNARAVAIMRGKMAGATVVLGSATPSIESYANAKAGKYSFSSLNHRATKANLPKVRFVDMKKEWAKKRGYQLLSEPLINAIKKRLSIGEQMLLFLNRRGYQTLQICTHCGQTLKCRHCDASLTFHKKDQTLCCHFCGFALSPPPTTCPLCQQTGYLEYKGIGTQKVERALFALFPKIRILRMDADTTRRKGSHDKLLKQFRSGKADLLIGTQMIAKGLHFPSVTLVAVLNSDSALHIPDFRASEYLFQLLVQVAGRAGRSELPGEVIIQTCLEKHPIFTLAASCDYATFFERELEGRKQFHFPPFTRLTKLVFSGQGEEPTLRAAERFRNALLPLLDSSFTLYPIIPCGYAKIKDRYRFKLIIKGANIYALNKHLTKLKEALPSSKQLRLLIDTDPTSTF